MKKIAVSVMLIAWCCSVTWAGTHPILQRVPSLLQEGLHAPVEDVMHQALLDCGSSPQFPNMKHKSILTLNHRQVNDRTEFRVFTTDVGQSEELIKCLVGHDYFHMEPVLLAVPFGKAAVGHVAVSGENERIYIEIWPQVAGNTMFAPDGFNIIAQKRPTPTQEMFMAYSRIVNVTDMERMLEWTRLNVNFHSLPLGETPLHAVVGYTKKHPDEINKAINLLKHHGADLEARDGSGYTPLMTAAQRGFEAAVSTLLHLGAQVNAHTKTGETPLMLAAIKGRNEIVQILLKAGAIVETKDHAGRNALWWATRFGHYWVVETLIHAGANVNTADADGVTPLMLAFQARYSRNPPLVALLLAAGAQSLTSNEKGQIAFDLLR